MSTDFWGGQAGAPQEESTPTFSNVPAQAWVLAKTTTEENGGAACKVRTIEPKGDRTETLYQFSLGSIVTGGGNIGKGKEKVDSKFDGRYLFGSFWIHPRAEDVDDPADVKRKLNSRLVGALNSIFSPGVGEEHIAALPKGAGKEEKQEAQEKRSAARWTNTLEQLQAAGELEGVSRESYTDENGELDFPLMVCACAVLALSKESRNIIVRTRADKRKRNGEDVEETVVGSIADLTKENFDKFGIEVFQEENAPSLGANF